jgi:hypothetical protein
MNLQPTGHGFGLVRARVRADPLAMRWGRSKQSTEHEPADEPRRAPTAWDGAVGVAGPPAIIKAPRAAAVAAEERRVA